MAIYRTISMSFWSDTKIVDNFSPEDKYFMLYCLTNTYTNLCGCYEISIKQMARDTGYNEETIKTLLKRFTDEYKIIQYDEENKELFIKNWSKYNWTKSSKLDKPLLEDIKKIKTRYFKEEITKIYNKRDTVSIPYIYPIDITDTDTDTISNINNNINNKRKSFIKPTIYEIQTYCNERNNSINAEAFYDFYESKDWYVGKNKMKDWKACIRTWEQRNKKEENIPDWFDKDIEKKITDNEMKEIELIIGAYNE